MTRVAGARGSTGSALRRLTQTLERAYTIGRQEGLGGLGLRLQHRLSHQREEKAYRAWVERFDTLTDTDRQAIRFRIQGLASTPLISVVMPVYNVDECWLKRAIESVRRQLYPNWELCIADDHSTQPHVRAVLNEYVGLDPRVRVTFRDQNGHISAASNSALDLATGEFVALLDHDDEIPEHALYLVVEELNAYPHANVIYSDEDKIDERGGRFSPFFKPDWNPDLLLSLNLLTHLLVYRTSVVRRVGGFRIGYEGAQDYDLALRVTEAVPEATIRHIPHVLYHWRSILGSMARGIEKDYVINAGKRALEDHFERRGIAATVTWQHNCLFRTSYSLSDPLPLVSLILTTNVDQRLLGRAIRRILDRTAYGALEILLVEAPASGWEPYAQSESSDLSGLQTDSRLRILRPAGPLGQAARVNLAARHARGTVLGLVGLVEPISGDWLSEMVSHALRPEIGAVGAKLSGPGERIEHAGIILGINGGAGYAYRGLSNRRARLTARASVTQNYSAVVGSCLVLRREVFDEVGGLDEVNLPLVFHDIDLCLRLGERGYRVVWSPYAELNCLARARVPELFEQDKYMFSRWAELIRQDPCYNPNLTLEREDFSLATPPRAVKPWS
jgi:GT2 family glycosyltransferase